MSSKHVLRFELNISHHNGIHFLHNYTTTSYHFTFFLSPNYYDYFDRTMPRN
jgi:hypothetical protein